MPLGLGAQALSTLGDDPNDNEDPEDQIYEKYNALLHGANKSKSYAANKILIGKSSNLWITFRKRIFSMTFMRKYLYIAKCVVPVLTDEAARAIAEEYASLRSLDLVENDVARVIELLNSCCDCNNLLYSVLADSTGDCTYFRNAYSSFNSARQGSTFKKN